MNYVTLSAHRPALAAAVQTEYQKKIASLDVPKCLHGLFEILKIHKDENEVCLIENVLFGSCSTVTRTIKKKLFVLSFFVQVKDLACCDIASAQLYFGL